MGTQLEVAEVLSVGGSVLTVLVALYTATLKWGMSNKDKADAEARITYDLKIEQLRRQLEEEKVARLAAEKNALENEKKYSERLHLDELETTKLAGNLALLKQAQEHHAKLVDDVERGAVTKQEFEARFDGVTDQLERIYREIERAARYPQPQHRNYSPARGIPVVRDDRRDDLSTPPPAKSR